MSITLRRIQSIKALHSFQLPLREYGHNLKREFSLLCTADKNSNFLNSECHRVPSRSFYKNEVEVNKRIQWKRPEKVPSILPEKSGDLSGLPELDLSKPPPLFEQSTEYQSANDLVKLVLSLQFQPRDVRRQYKIDVVTQKVKRHKFDTNSVEVKIAKYTAIIRNMQVHYSKYPRDRVGRADLKEIIEFRKKRMKLLRSLDYKRFEWLLEQLDLLYKPPPTAHERVERKKSMRWLAEQYIDKVKQKKLEDYKNTLDTQKRKFLERKLATMKTIIEEETSFGVDPSFSPDDIAQAEENLRQVILEEESASTGKEEVKEVY